MWDHISTEAHAVAKAAQSATTLSTENRELRTEN
jgi:hypothetical protein